MKLSLPSFGRMALASAVLIMATPSPVLAEPPDSIQQNSGQTAVRITEVMDPRAAASPERGIRNCVLVSNTKKVGEVTPIFPTDEARFEALDICFSAVEKISKVSRTIWEKSCAVIPPGDGRNVFPNMPDGVLGDYCRLTSTERAEFNANRRPGSH